MGKTLAKRQPADVAINAKIAELRDAGKLGTLEAGEDLADEMVERILNAKTDEEMFGATTPIEQLVGTVVKITGVNFRPSQKRANEFAVFSWEAQDGRYGITSNGGERLVATLINAVSRGAIPLACRVGSAEVEYEAGQFGTTYFLEPAR